MIVNVALVAVLGAIGASAVNTHAIRRSLALRQLSASDIPSACQSQCQSALTIYDACMNGDTNTCLGICQPSQFSDYRSCLSCILDNNPQATSDNVQAVNQALDAIEQLCDQVGSTVSAADFSATGGAIGGSGTDGGASATGTAIGGVSAASSAVAATTSAPLTSAIGGGAGTVSSAVNSISKAASGAANSASSAAATTSGAAAYAAQFPNMAGFAVAVVGVVAGAAVVF